MAHPLCERMLQRRRLFRLQHLPALPSHLWLRDCRWRFLSSATQDRRKLPYGVKASQLPCIHSQGWDAFSDAPYHDPVNRSRPVAVDGLDQHQVDMLFQQADWNQDGRQAVHPLPCSSVHCAWHQCFHYSSWLVTWSVSVAG